MAPRPWELGPWAFPGDGITWTGTLSPTSGLSTALTRTPPGGLLTAQAPEAQGLWAGLTSSWRKRTGSVPSSAHKARASRGPRVSSAFHGRAVSRVTPAAEWPRRWPLCAQRMARMPRSTPNLPLAFAERPPSASQQWSCPESELRGHRASAGTIVLCAHSRGGWEHVPGLSSDVARPEHIQTAWRRPRVPCSSCLPSPREDAHAPPSTAATAPSQDALRLLPRDGRQVQRTHRGSAAHEPSVRRDRPLRPWVQGLGTR